MPSELLKAPSVAPLFNELCRKPPALTPIAFQYWRQGGIFGEEDEALFLVRHYADKLDSARQRTIALVQTLNEEYRKEQMPHRKEPRSESSISVHDRARGLDQIIANTEQAIKAKRRKGRKQKEQPSKTPSIFQSPAFWLLVWQAPVEHREGIALLRRFNGALRKALGEEKRRWLNFDRARLAKPSNFLFAYDDILELLAVRAGTAVQKINTALQSVLTVEAKIGQWMLSDLGKTSRNVPDTGARLVRYLERNGIERRKAMEWAYQLMLAFDPGRIGSNFRSFQRNVRTAMRPLERLDEQTRIEDENITRQRARAAKLSVSTQAISS